MAMSTKSVRKCVLPPSKTADVSSEYAAGAADIYLVIFRVCVCGSHVFWR